MKHAAYLIHTRHGTGQYPEIVDRLTFDECVASAACDMDATVEALVTVSEAHEQVARAVERIRENER